jgi:hypothetical protein
MRALAAVTLLGLAACGRPVDRIKWPETSTDESRERFCLDFRSRHPDCRLYDPDCGLTRCKLAVLDRDLKILRSKAACRAADNAQVCAQLRAELEIR